MDIIDDQTAIIRIVYDTEYGKQTLHIQSVEHSFSNYRERGELNILSVTIKRG